MLRTPSPLVINVSGSVLPPPSLEIPEMPLPPLLAVFFKIFWVAAEPITDLLAHKITIVLPVIFHVFSSTLSALLLHITSVYKVYTNIKGNVVKYKQRTLPEEIPGKASAKSSIPLSQINCNRRAYTNPPKNQMFLDAPVRKPHAGMCQYGTLVVWLLQVLLILASQDIGCVILARFFSILYLNVVEQKNDLCSILKPKKIIKYAAIELSSSGGSVFYFNVPLRTV